MRVLHDVIALRDEEIGRLRGECFRMSQTNPTPEERKAKSAEDKRAVTIRVINNGYILRTRSGSYAYPDMPALIDALRDYLALIKKEMSENEKEI